MNLFKTMKKQYLFIISSLVLLVCVFFFQNCQKKSPSDLSETAYLPEDSLLYGSSAGNIFDCTPDGVSGAAWILNWSDVDGLSYYYSSVVLNPPAPEYHLMKMTSKTTPPEGATGGGPTEVWKTDSFEIEIRSLSSPDSPFARITTNDGQSQDCRKLP